MGKDLIRQFKTIRKTSQFFTAAELEAGVQFMIYISQNTTNLQYVTRHNAIIMEQRNAVLREQVTPFFSVNSF